MMGRKMHARTVALVLATTTTLQMTGVASKLVNGEAFVVANAIELSAPALLQNTESSTTSAAVIVTGSGIDPTTSGQVSVRVPRIITEVEELNSLDSIQFQLDVTTSGGVQVIATTSAAVNWTVVGNSATTSGMLTEFIEANGQSYYLSDPCEYKFYIEIKPDKYGLQEDLKDAYVKYTEALSGQYQDRAISAFKTALVTAQGVLDNQAATQKEVNDAIAALAMAITAFENSKTTNSVNPATPTDEVQKVTTPSAVIIKGTERVGKTLTAQLLSEDASEFTVTTSASVRYEWYRLSSKSSNPKLVGKDSTYDLVNSDNGKYIKLVVYYGDKLFEDITSRIDKRNSSSSSSSSSSNSKSNSSSNDTTVNKESKPKTVGIEKNSDGTMKLVEDGKPVVGWKQVNGAWYLSNPKGIVQTGWQQTNGSWYLLKDDGAMATGWQQTNGRWYLLNSDGAMATGWQQTNGKWYLLKSDGAMATGWQQTNDKWYYLNNDGSMASNTVIDGYKVDASGAWVK